jgi:hypothetical protein
MSMGKIARRVAAACFAASAALITSAHIGDSNTHFRGAAGPYTVQVVVRHPGVVPGLADITVRVEDAAAVDRVTVRPVQWRLGLEGAPRPDVAVPVPGAPGLHAAQLWFMERGSYSVHVEIEGALGAGTAVVPVQSLATGTLAMPRGLGFTLVVLGVLLVSGFITIVRAAAGESLLPPGVAPDARTRRRGRVAAGVAMVVLVVVLAGGWRWWSSEDAAYRRTIFRPLAIDASVTGGVDARVLTIAIVDSIWTSGRFTPIVPDHGKMMHAFLIREPGLDVFAHVHPAPIARDTFLVLLPPLPPGSYRLYAEIVHESGFAQTLTHAVEIDAAAVAAVASPPPLDADDSWWAGVAAAAGEAMVTLDDGATIRWQREEEPVAGRPIELRFEVSGPAGQPAALEPYMGMMAHAALRRDDGSVFVHLHPTGSISMAAQALLEERHLGIVAPDAGHAAHATHGAATGAPAVETIIMPYAFPEPGRYRLWIQVMRAGQARTAAFDVEVGGR